MSIVNKGNVLRGRNVELVVALVLILPESSIHKEELLCPLKQVSAGSIIEVVRLMESRCSGR
jgi:hypothetical protein